MFHYSTTKRLIVTLTQWCCHLLLYDADSAQDATPSTFKLCHSELRKYDQLVLEPGATYSPGDGLRVGRFSRNYDTMWYVDPKTKALKTLTNNLCVHQRQGAPTVSFCCTN